VIVRFIAALAAMLLLGTLAAAQEYSIRANRGLNLRTAPSLNAEIAGTVRSGAVLQVVGDSGRWLKIDWPGNDVWLANWVNYSRVENGSQPPSQTGTSSPIDNCCFVDRQCSSDQEWIDGYWAYQNNQCPALTGSQVQTVSPPAPSVAAEVDNCCYIDRHCQTNQQWMDGYWAFQNKQCAAPELQSPVTTSGAIIEGSEIFVARISAALDLLRIRAPQWHAYVTKGPRKIAESHLGAPDGYAAGDSIYISPSAAAKPAHILAELLVHEACHVQRTLAGLLRYETVQQQDFEEALAGYVMRTAAQQIEYGRMIMTFTPSQVARLIRYGKLYQPTGTGLHLVTYVTGDVWQLLREGIDFFGAVRAEIARAASLLG